MKDRKQPFETTCVECGQEIVVLDEKNHPHAVVRGGGKFVYFCDVGHNREWQEHHCLWCGTSGRTRLLTIETDEFGPRQQFCDVHCLDSYRGLRQVWFDRPKIPKALRA